MKIAIAQINPVVGDILSNVEKIVESVSRVNADIIVFPELAVTGYPLEDLVLNPAFLKSVDKANQLIAKHTAHLDVLIIFGTVRNNNRAIYNSAFLLYKGEVVHVVDKKSLPNYGVFDEKRTFAMRSCNNIYNFKGQNLLILICEDIWHKSTYENYTHDSCDLIITLNASPFEVGKFQQRTNVVRQLVQHFGKDAVYVNLVGGQDEIVFDGASFMMKPDESIVSLCDSWSEDVRILTDEHASYDTDDIADTYNALVLGLRDYVAKTGFSKVILGLSGGIDSALVAAIAADALSPKMVTGVRLPSQYSSNHSLKDAADLAQNLEINMFTINIEESVDSILRSVSKHFQTSQSDTTEENLQSRARAIILMALSNKNGDLLLATGNKSEYAVGYATLYGDMCGAFAPIKDVYKTNVFELANWRNANIPKLSLCQKLDVIPQHSILKPPSAELREDQKDSDSLPEYDVLDSVLYDLIERDVAPKHLHYDPELVKKVVKLIKNSEFKRRQAAIGTIVTSKNFGKGRRMPIANKYGYEIL